MSTDKHYPLLNRILIPDFERDVTMQWRERVTAARDWGGLRVERLIRAEPSDDSQ